MKKPESEISQQLTPCLKVHRSHGQKALSLTRKMGILNREFRIGQEQDFLHIPLTRELLTTELTQLNTALPESEICMRQFERTKQRLSLVDILEERVPPHVLASLPHAVDFVGDIAVVEIPPELESYKQEIGEALLKTNKRLRTVLAKSGGVSGVYRLRPFEVIGGEAKTHTIYREHGCVFHVDLAKAYFSPRLSYEHKRVASMVKPRETVVDMFAGLGSFSILIAKRIENVRVYAIDLNPDAIGLLKKNVIANRVEARVQPISGDARQVINEKLGYVADRVIMNLPEKASEFVDAACRAIKKDGGIIHYYEFSNASQPLETAERRLAEVVKQADRQLDEVLHVRIVRGIAPFAYQIVVDAEIR